MPGSISGRPGRPRGVLVRPDAVRQARLDAGLSLAQVAEGQLTRAAIHLVETGRTRPSERTLELIARKTGRPISFFLPAWEGTDEQRAGRDELERLFDTEDFDAAVALGERLLGEDLSPGIEADVRFYLGSALIRMHEGERAHPHISRAHRLYEEVGDARMVVEALDQEACAYLLLHDPRALAVAVEALRRCELLNPMPDGLQVRILLHLGTIYQRDGDWANAVRFLEMGLELSRSSANPNPRHRAMLHDMLSLSHQELGSFSTAIEHGNRAFKLYAMDRDARSMARIENNLGYLLLREGELDAAEPHLLRSLALCDERGLERHGRAFVLCSLAELHIARGHLDEAESCAREALDIAESFGETRTRAIAHRLQGRLSLRRGDRAAADDAFERALALFRTLNMPERLRECLVEYAEALQERGLLERSIVHWREAAQAAREAGVAASSPTRAAGGSSPAS